MTEQKTIPDYPRGITFEQVWAALMEDREQLKKTEMVVENIGKRMGYMDNRFGELAEHLVAPGIMDKFNEMGFNFTRCSNNVKIKENGNPYAITEVDLLLENGDIVIAVEVKVKPKLKDVEEHIERMQKLRSDANRRNDTRRYCGAIAAPIMSDDIRRYVQENGFFSIEQSGDTMKINVPPDFVPREF